MLEETDDNWTECIEKVLELSPDCITIYQMEVPFNTTIFKSMKDQGKLTAPVADWPTKRRWVTQAYGALEKAGYTVTSAYTAVKDPENTKFIYRDRLWAGADMVALGVASFGHLGGIHYQNQTHFDQYCETQEETTSAFRRALLTTEDERFVREFILQWKLGRVSPSYFSNKFDVDIHERFSEIFTDWKNAGDLYEKEGDLLLTRDALLRIDSMLHRFFLPQHQYTKYV
jgi:oxygen-independent coproporphyrinogen-3 oxidase